MKFAFLLVAALVGSVSFANAGAVDHRTLVRMECRMAARSMNYVPNTQKWKNSIRMCMIDAGVKGR